MLDELGNAQKVRIGGMVQLTVRVKPAQKKRQGRNPATGEEITIAAKPASVDLRARPLTKAKQRCRRCRRRAGGSPRNSGFPSETSRRPLMRLWAPREYRARVFLPATIARGPGDGSAPAGASFSVWAD